MNNLSLNTVTVRGFLGNDPEIRNTQSRGKIMTLSIATTENWKDKNSGEWKSATEWHRVVVFKDTIVTAFEREEAARGDLVEVTGKLKTNKWQDQDGKDRYTTEIQATSFDHRATLIRTKNSPIDRSRDGNVSD
ncbi:MAG: single-stranded DNA-binding protein [Pseudomonadota bacterium]